MHYPDRAELTIEFVQHSSVLSAYAGASLLNRILGWVERQDGMIPGQQKAQGRRLRRAGRVCRRRDRLCFATSRRAARNGIRSCWGVCAFVRSLLGVRAGARCLHIRALQAQAMAGLSLALRALPLWACWALLHALLVMLSQAVLPVCIFL